MKAPYNNSANCLVRLSWVQRNRQLLTRTVGLFYQLIRTGHLGYLSAFRAKNLRLLVEKIQSLMLIEHLPGRKL
jgi:hypothetical protein